jgi:uncharacterized protein
VALILDTGPLYASLDRSDADHARCRSLIEQAEEPRIIPSPVLAEVDYWIHARMHAGVLRALLDDVVAGAYRVEDLTAEDYVRVRELCDTYADADIGFVDAAVFATVERPTDLERVRALAPVGLAADVATRAFERTADDARVCTR